MKNILDVAPKSLRSELKAHIRSIFEAANEETARRLLHQTVELFQDQAPKAMEILEDGFDDATAVLELHADYRKKLRTTNCVERLNAEIRRRERVIAFSQIANPYYVSSERYLWNKTKNGQRAKNTLT